MVEKQIIVGNQLVNYLASIAQNSAAPAVVFLHGWRSSAEVWKGIIGNLPNVNCYALDMPGFGKSEKPRGVFDLSDYVAVVLGFINKLELKSVILVGHSFGGRVAIKFSVVEPDLVSKLVLVDSAGFRLNKKRVSLFRWGSKLARPIISAFRLESLRGSIYKAIGAEDYLATPELRKTFINIVNEDLSALLKGIRQKTLIVWGAKDEETPVFLGTWLKENIRDSNLVVFENAGHYSFLDKPQEFEKALKEFI